MKSLRVLVVDDDALNLRIAARLLRALGHSGALANGGDKALQISQSQQFDLMLLDINMPGKNGADTLQELRLRERAGRGRHLPVLMVSGYADQGTQQFYLDAGADGFLPKPLDSDALVAAIAGIQGL